MSGVMQRRWGALLLARGDREQRPGASEATGATEPAMPSAQPDMPRPSFAEVYAQHFDFVWRSLRHLGVTPPALDDAVQEVWLVVHQKLPLFEGRSRATTWLFGIALNIARSQRRKGRAMTSEPLPDEVPSRSPDPEKTLVGQDAWQQVQTFLETLDDLPRAIFVSALLENLTPAETAEAIGVEVELVYRRVRALRRAFARQLARREESST